MLESLDRLTGERETLRPLRPSALCRFGEGEREEPMERGEDESGDREGDVRPRRSLLSRVLDE